MLNISEKTLRVKFVVKATARTIAAELSTAYPLLAAQFEQGAAIVSRGDVLLAPYHNYVTVRDEAQPLTEYLVQNRGGVGWFCQCTEWEEGREARFYPRKGACPTQPGIGTVCKHSAAVWIAWELGLVPGTAL